jgi:3-oxoacyl-[acyl-carrier-protein] synthase II
MKRVVVTGVGPVSSIGIGKEPFWERAKQGKGYFRNVSFTNMDIDISHYRSRVCSPIEGFDPEEHVENGKKLKKSSLATQYSIVGTYLALQDAGISFKEVPEKSRIEPAVYPVDGVDPMRCGFIIGQSVSNTDIMIPRHAKLIKSGSPRGVNPNTLPQSNINVGASTAAEWFCLRGTNFTIATACSSANHAIGMAAMNIQCGTEDIVVTGGAEGTLEPYLFLGFDIIRSLSTRNDDPMHSSRPFDRGRDGFVLGEGAGILVLEELDHALKRGARIYAELVGHGYSADGYNIVAPDPLGRSSVNAIRKALAMAKISPEEVEYINAHGTSTVINDPNESHIIKEVFGDYAYRIPISSSKSYFGHPLGAAAGLESIVTALTVANDTITPTANLENPDVDFVDPAFPDLDKRCDLDYVPKKAREQQVNVALKESFGFGGQNGAIVFRKFEA